jgi:hypothetical protein
MSDVSKSIEDYLLVKQELDRLCLQVKETKKLITEKERLIFPFLHSCTDQKIDLKFKNHDIVNYGPHCSVYIHQEKRRSSVTFVHLKKSIREFMGMKFKDNTGPKLDQVSSEMAKYIWDGRTYTNIPRVMCKSFDTIVNMTD